MFVWQAKEIAQQWVNEEGRKIPDVAEALLPGQKAPGFVGAFLHGSINDLPDDAVLPETSDVDVMLVLSDTVASATPPAKLGKFLYRDVLLEVSELPHYVLSSPEVVLSHYQLAGSIRKPGILADPTGYLTQIHEVVSENFAKRRWVQERCAHARQNSLNFLESVGKKTRFHEQVPAWLFGTGVTTHVLLVAGLRNPTVRRRYVAVQKLLANYDLSDFHETLLEMLGCARMTLERASYHLANLADAFDTAGSVLKTPYQFAADMMAAARPIAIDGSRELIESGLHREAVFWITAVYSRCQWVLAHDALPKVQDKHSEGYHELLADLDITSFADLQQRSQQTKDFLPRVWEVAEMIMERNSEIDNQ